MQVYFLKSVPSVGEKGTVATVQPGFARNYLFPRKLAVPATPALLERAARDQSRIAARQRRKAAAQQTLAEALTGRSVRLEEKAEGERLFGSVSAGALRDAVQAQLQLDVPADAFVLPSPIKSIGTHTVQVRCGAATATLTVEVERA